MAPSEEIFLTVVEKLDKIIHKWEESKGLEPTEEEPMDEMMESPDPHCDLTEFPSEGSLLVRPIIF